MSMITLPVLQRVCGVDFSGASKSGKTAWLADFEVDWSKGNLRLAALAPLGRLAGSDERVRVCEYLAEAISSSSNTLWAMDFPFALPIELGGRDWHAQLDMVASFETDPGRNDAAAVFGRHLSTHARQVMKAGRIRRKTDIETSTPFDSYHYRIIYQTFHGMRDVLLPLTESAATAVLPFQYCNLASASRVVVESCPASFLKRWNLPHSRYKQTGCKPPNPVHRANRSEILRGVHALPEVLCEDRVLGGAGKPRMRVPSKFAISEHRRRVIMKDSGGDALDAVLAGLGGWRAFYGTNHGDVMRDQRYCFEGRVYS